MIEQISNPESIPGNKIPAVISAEVTLLIEKFPHIGNRIELLWGTVDLQDYLNTLIVDERSGRKGFPHLVAGAILRIHTEHYKLIKPKLNKNKSPGRV
ncbi:MAG: hypothetical protein WCB93_08785 [Gallionella sp.]